MEVGGRLRAELEALAPQLQVAGAVVGVDVGGERFVHAWGYGNLNTGEAFTEDTGWLLGSVTKVLTATLLMRLVERGEVDLAAPARRYVPDFALADEDAVDAITVRMLVNHTNGMDADALRPTAVRGRDAVRSYLEALAQFGVLFEPGAGLHYSNPGFATAARVIEECTGLPFEEAMRRELLEPAGMQDSTLVHTEAFLRRTAIGAFADGEGTMRATRMFSLGESGAGGGSTLVVTAADMLAFGRMHLHGGVAPNGARIIGQESVRAMQTQTYDLGLLHSWPIGLGWWLRRIAGTVAPWHAGGSPGGASLFAVLPEHDAVVVGFATGPGNFALNDRLVTAAIEEITGRLVELPLELAHAPIDADSAGVYASFQRRQVAEVAGGELVVTESFEPWDEVHRRNHEEFNGTTERVLVTRYRGVAPGVYAPVGSGPQELRGLMGTSALLTSLPPAAGRRPGLQSGFRYIPRVS